MKQIFAALIQAAPQVITYAAKSLNGTEEATIQVATVNGNVTALVNNIEQNCGVSLTQVVANGVSTVIEQGASLCMGRDPFYLNWALSTVGEVANQSLAMVECVTNMTKRTFGSDDESVNADCPSGLSGDISLPLVGAGVVLAAATVGAAVTGIAVWRHMRNKKHDLGMYNPVDETATRDTFTLGDNPDITTTSTLRLSQ